MHFRLVVIDHTPERAAFDYGGLEITRKWGKMKELEMNFLPGGYRFNPVEVHFTQ
jgi:hypothetical protein